MWEATGRKVVEKRGVGEAAGLLLCSVTGRPRGADSSSIGISICPRLGGRGRGWYTGVRAEAAFLEAEAGEDGRLGLPRAASLAARSTKGGTAFLEAAAGGEMWVWEKSVDRRLSESHPGISARRITLL